MAWEGVEVGEGVGVGQGQSTAPVSTSNSPFHISNGFEGLRTATVTCAILI